MTPSPGPLRSAGDDADEMRVARIELRERRCKRAREWVVARSPRIGDVQAVSGEDVAEPGERQDVYVLPRLALRFFPA